MPPTTREEIPQGTLDLLILKHWIAMANSTDLKLRMPSKLYRKMFCT